MDLEQFVSYPIVADGRIFVTVGGDHNIDNEYGTTLHAFDLATGARLWGPVDLGGTYNWSALSYTDGRVFAVTRDGRLRAYDGLTGIELWDVTLPRVVWAPPTAAEGLLYLASPGAVFAVRPTDGSIAWATTDIHVGWSSPAVAGGTLFVASACARTTALNAASGAVRWEAEGSCHGGGGQTVAVYGDRVYVRDTALFDRMIVYRASDGERVGSFESAVLPTFDGNTGYFLNTEGKSGYATGTYVAGTLEARDLRTGLLLWRFAGDGYLTSAPILIGRTIVVGSLSGEIFGLDPLSGLQLWHQRWHPETVPTPVLSPEMQTAPPGGIVAGQGYLAVPARTHLLIYRAFPSLSSVLLL